MYEINNIEYDHIVSKYGKEVVEKRCTEMMQESLGLLIESFTNAMEKLAETEENTEQEEGFALKIDIPHDRNNDLDVFVAKEMIAPNIMNEFSQFLNATAIKPSDEDMEELHSRLPDVNFAK